MANRPAPALALREGDRVELERLTRASSVRAGLAQRARIVLLAAAGVPNTEIAERLGVARQTVLTWRARYRERGLAGLEDIPKPGKPRRIDPRRIIARDVEAAAEESRRDALVDTAAGDAVEGRQLDHRQGVARARDPAVEVRVVPVLHRPRAGGEGRRRRRLVPGPTRRRGGAVLRREVADPGLGADSADPADAAAPDRAPLP